MGLFATLRLVGRVVFLDYAALGLGMGAALRLGMVVLIDFKDILVILRGKDL